MHAPWRAPPPRRLVAALILAGMHVPLSLASGVSYTSSEHVYCGGGGPGSTNSCDMGPNAGKLPNHGMDYFFMGDVPLSDCKSRCAHIGCPCFDFSATPARTGENCRVCKPGQKVLPLWKSSRSCIASLPNKESALAQSWGWTLITAIVGGSLVYLGVGFVYGTIARKKRGMKALPHRAFWRELRSQVADGVAYLRGGGRRGRYKAVTHITEAGQKPIKSPPRGALKDKTRSPKDKKEKKGKKGKKEKKEKKGKEENKGKEGKKEKKKKPGVQALEDTKPDSKSRRASCSRASAGAAPPLEDDGTPEWAERNKEAASQLTTQRQTWDYYNPDTLTE